MKNRFLPYSSSERLIIHFLETCLQFLESQVLSVVVYEQVSLSKYSPSAIGPDTQGRGRNRKLGDV